MTTVRSLSIAAFLAVSLSLSAGPADSPGKPLSRGIGIYPGNPAESFAPRMVKDDSYRNLALNRVVTTSSDFDYNLTGQLVADGIVSSGEGSSLEVFTPEGPLDRKERESTIDGGEYSRNALEGDDAWLEYRWRDYLLRADSVAVACETVYRESDADGKWKFSLTSSDADGGETVLGSASGDELPGRGGRPAFNADPNKQVAVERLPSRRIRLGFPLDNPYGVDNAKLRLEMKGAVNWRVTEVYFYRNGRRIFDMLPSYRFSSLWKSAGTDAEWLSVDLGTVADIDRIVVKWIDRPRVREIEVSEDGKQWNGVPVPGKDYSLVENIKCNASGRYVRVRMSGGTPEGTPYSITELEVWGRGGLVAEPVPSPELENGDLSLDGGDWKLQRASEVGRGGEMVSSEDFFPDGWLTATVPATVLMSYVNAGALPDPNYDDNVNKISESFFNGDFWYRREFDAPEGAAGKDWFLCFDGINWKAEVWLNGKNVDFIEGAFTRDRAKVTLKEHNVLAVKIIGNSHIGGIKEKTAITTGFNGGILGADNPTFHASIGWDWITTVRGRNSGIWNDVFLSPVKAVRLSDPLVTTVLSDDGKASVTASVIVEGDAGPDVEVTGWIGDRRFSKKVGAGFCGELSFTPEEFANLRNQEMKLWWPNGYGEPYLYDAGFEVKVGGEVVDALTYKAGIREVTWTDIDTALKIYVNGRRFIPLGGNWGFGEHNLCFRGREYDIAVDYHRQMNYNMIRNWVGQVGDEEFYEACDRHGIMVWQDFWLANPADGPDPYYEDLFCANARDYVLRIRRHPSIALYCGRNEGSPPKTIDDNLKNEVVAVLHPGIPYIPDSAAGGVSGHGPYRAMTPKYYFEHQSGKLHSERGMPNVPTFESLSRMLAPENFWPQNDLWGKHDYTLEGAQGARSFNEIISNAFGESSSAEEFTALAQWVNYDGYRAMYESGSKDRMGLLIWMSHSCWPSMTWCTYDYYFEPTGAFFGVKKACEPLHIQFNASTSDIEVVNLCAGDRNNLRAIARVYDYKGKLLSSQEAALSSPVDSNIPCLKVQAPENVGVYYLKLLLLDASGKVLSDNFYIQGEEYGNLQAVRTLPAAKVKKTVRFSGESAEVTLKNTGKTPALLLRLTLKGSDGNEILPVDYSDNYFSLLPGESRTVSVNWDSFDARGLSPEITLSGLNL
ncbi:MAG: discoidin domain-containing protein [Bacteroidales bacterium]|nr:discoidin domain-containing protein [Bacteroidales bacterium]